MKKFIQKKVVHMICKKKYIHITNHAKKRLRQRNGINKKSINRIAEKAYYHGLKHSETTGNLNKWITKLYFMYKKANSIRIYGDKAYLFANSNLITVLQVPSNLLQIVKENKKRKEKCQ